MVRFAHAPTAEVRDFHCYSHVSDNLGELSIPSDHVAERIVVQKPTNRCDQVKRNPSWMSKHQVFCTFLEQTSDGHHSDEPFATLTDFIVIVEKPMKQTHQELLRNTLGSLGAKLSIASTALRAYRNRHLGALMRCCAAWEPVGKCFDQCSFECIDFHGLSQIIASLMRERIAEREAAFHNRPWKKTEKDNALAKCRLSLRALCIKKPMLCLHAVTDEDGHPLEDEDESGIR